MTQRHTDSQTHTEAETGSTRTEMDNGTKSTDYAGIDYSGSQGTCNRDEREFRYGIIAQSSLPHWFADELEAHYSAHCPACGEGIDSEYESEVNSQGYGVCECGNSFRDHEMYRDEADGYTWGNEDSESGHADDMLDVWVTQSPFYTYAQFCSPCVPGAGNLNSPLAIAGDIPKENRILCLGLDWFDSLDDASEYAEHCPYPVWECETGNLVYVPPGWSVAVTADTQTEEN